MKSTAFTRFLAMLLVLTMTVSAGLILPARAADSAVTYAAGDNEHSIYWAHGIRAPQVPEDFAGDTPLVIPYDPEGGWYDLSVSGEAGRSGAAAAANLLHWWLNLNSGNLEKFFAKEPAQPEEYQQTLADPMELKNYLEAPKSQKLEDSPIYGYFQEAAGGKSYAPDSYIDLFLNGYPLQDKKNSPEIFEPKDGVGGFLFPVVDMITKTNRITEFMEFEKTGTLLKNVMTQDCGMIIALEGKGGKTVYVNLWGAEFDAEGKLCAVYITDTSDTGDDQQAMVRYAVQEGDNNAVVMSDLMTRSKGLTWKAMYLLYSGAYDFSWYLDQKEIEQELPDGDYYPETEDIPMGDEEGPLDGPVLQDAVVWEATVYSWAENMGSCTASRQDSNDKGNVEKEIVEVKTTTKEATSQEAGLITYTAEFTKEWAEDQTKTEEIPAKGNQWGDVQYQWSEEHKSCKAVRADKEDPSITQTAVAKVSAEQTKAPTETEKGETTYTASFKEDWAKDQTKTVADIPAKGPQWGAVSYTWSDGNMTCTATREGADGKTQTAKAKVTVKTVRKGNCTEEGEAIHTAVFQEDWAKNQEKIVNAVNPDAHEWGSVTYEWSKDNRNCRAVRVCKHDSSHKLTATATVTSKITKDPTEKNKGETTYWAEFREDWAKNQKTVAEDIPALEDSWEPVTYTWTNNNRQCTAKRVNRQDDRFNQTAIAKVSFRQTKAPTETQKGETTYTAAFREGWAKDQQKVVADVPALKEGDGVWSAPVYEWSLDYSRCTASRSKKNDPSTVDMAHGKVTVKEVKPATCLEPGESIYTAAFKESWAKDQQETVTVKEGKHSLKQVQEIPATGTSYGTKAHYECTVCGKLFADAEGKQEVQESELVIKEAPMSGSNAVIIGVPEMPGSVAIPLELLNGALKDNRDAKGILVEVGDISVVYARATAEQIARDHKDAKKLVLQVVKSNYGDGALTTDQALSLQKNSEGTLYRVALTEGKKEIQADCTVMLPYTAAGTGATQVFQVAEDGSFRKTNSQLANGYLAWNADTGFYLATEQEPVVEAAKKGGSGIIVWIVILVVVGLAFIGGGGFLIYKKVMADKEEDFMEKPQLDQAARNRIRNQAQAPAKPQNKVQTAQSPRPAAPAQKPQAAQQYAQQQSQQYAAPTAPVQQPQHTAQASVQQLQYAAPVQQSQQYVQQAQYGQQAAYGAQTVSEPTQTFQAPVDAPQGYYAQTPQSPAAPQPDAGYQGAFAAHEAPKTYQGAFEHHKPSMADKAVKAAHRSQPEVPQQPEMPSAPGESDELDALKDWLDQIDD